MSISSDTLRGHTDTIILTQLMRGDNYGYEINKTIQQRTNGQYGFKEATLYTAFRRLEQSGLITSYWGRMAPAHGAATTPSPTRDGGSGRKTAGNGRTPGRCWTPSSPLRRNKPWIA